jgi:hypothetical protein
MYDTLVQPKNPYCTVHCFICFDRVHDDSRPSLVFFRCELNVEQGTKNQRVFIVVC